MKRPREKRNAGYALHTRSDAHVVTNLCLYCTSLVSLSLCFPVSLSRARSLHLSLRYGVIHEERIRAATAARRERQVRACTEGRVL